MECVGCECILHVNTKLMSLSVFCFSARATLLREDWDQREATEKLQLSLLQLVEFINQFRTSQRIPCHEFSRLIATYQ